MCVCLWNYWERRKKEKKKHREEKKCEKKEKRKKKKKKKEVNTLSEHGENSKEHELETFFFLRMETRKINIFTQINIKRKK